MATGRAVMAYLLPGSRDGSRDGPSRLELTEVTQNTGIFWATKYVAHRAIRDGSRDGPSRRVFGRAVMCPLLRGTHITTLTNNKSDRPTDADAFCPSAEAEQTQQGNNMCPCQWGVEVPVSASREIRGSCRLYTADCAVGQSRKPGFFQP
jgi:hypothetical protein